VLYTAGENRCASQTFGIALLGSSRGAAGPMLGGAYRNAGALIGLFNQSGIRKWPEIMGKVSPPVSRSSPPHPCHAAQHNTRADVPSKVTPLQKYLAARRKRVHSHERTTSNSTFALATPF